MKLCMARCTMCHMTRQMWTCHGRDAGARVGSYVCALYLTQFGEIGRSREGNGRGYLVRAIV